MTTVIPEEIGTAPATAKGKKPKANKKAHIAPRRADVATAKAKLARKATPAKKAPKGRTKPKSKVVKPEVAKSKLVRDGSKTAKILDLLKRPGGATSQELMKANGWLPHSVRGFLSGTVRKKMGLTVTSTKSEDGERTYSVEA